jgi:hypothetical protein
MPFTKCPVCGEIMHLNVSDQALWHATYYHDLPGGSLVPGRCLYCWPELNVGDQVVIRQCLAGPPQAAIGDNGTINAVLSSPEHGTIYEVRLAAGKERYFIRAELRKAEPQSIKVQPAE